MKNLIIYVCTSVMVCWLFASCNDDKHRLVNKWQLRKYEFADGSEQKVDSIFFNMKGGSLSVTCLHSDGNYYNYLGKYILSDDKISFILLPEQATGSVYDKYIGWEDGSRTFDLVRLTRKAMELDYKDTISVFRKY
ncbi:MAG: lipocalin-like domain-containing protein [Bacteroides sp.]|nr:lipocalin-like domain-containing protein [Bacteroides sp.]